jgi:hypothetical protein
VPAISKWNGIKIEMFYQEHGIQHHEPHFHAKYAEYSATISIASLSLLAGYLPTPQWREVSTWSSLHRHDLQENWQRLKDRKKHKRIKGLY